MRGRGAKQSNLSSLSSQSNDLSTYMTQSPPKDPTEHKMQSKYQELFDTEIEAQQVAPPELVPADEDPVIDEILKEEPENQVVVYGPQRATAQTATATQQMIGMDNSSIPAFLRPINEPLPAIHFKDIIGVKPTAAETKDIRQARINKLDKKPLLAIDEEPFNLPKISEEDMKKYRAQTAQNRQAEEKQAEEPSEPTSTSIEGYDEFQKYITDKEKKRKKEITNGILGKMLIKNNIKDPKTGKPFIIDPSNRVKVKGSSTALNNTQLTELLETNYKPGFIYKKLS